MREKIFAYVMLGFVVIMMITFCVVILIASYWDNTGTNRIIYDRKNQRVLAPEDMTFWLWLKNRNSQEYQYYFLAEEYEFLVYGQSYAFKARVRLPKTEEAVKQFYASSNYHLLSLACEQCVSQVAKEFNQQNLRAKENSQKLIRAVSIPNMNELCPLTGHGYQWAGSLELAECPLPEVKDGFQEKICLDIVRNR